MIRDDLLLRTIQRLAEAIGRIVGLAKQGRAEEAARALEEATRSNIGMPGAMLERLPPEEIARTLGAEKSMIIAALLDAEADLARAGGDAPRARERNTRADAIRTAAGLPVERRPTD